MPAVADAPKTAVAPAPAPAAPRVDRDAPTYTSALSELDALANEPETPEAPVELVEEPAKPVEKKVEAKVVEPVVPDPVKEPVKEPEKPAGTAKELRTALENAKRDAQSLREELDKYKTGKVEDPEKKSVLEKLESEQKARAEIEKELRFTNYEKSQEYKERYDLPIRKAFDVAFEDLKGFKISMEDGTEREATPNDFNALVQTQSAAVASVKAKELFGDGAGEILAHRRKILELNSARLEAIDKFQKEGAEREKNAGVDRTVRQQKVMDLYQSSSKAISEKNPEFFTAKEGDEELNTALEEGGKIADFAFQSVSLNPNIPIEKQVPVHALVRQRAAAFPRVTLENKRLGERVKALEKEIEQLRGSTPGPGTGTPAPVATGVQSWEQEIDALVTK